MEKKIYELPLKISIRLLFSWKQLNQAPVVSFLVLLVFQTRASTRK